MTETTIFEDDLDNENIPLHQAVISGDLNSKNITCRFDPPISRAEDFRLIVEDIYYPTECKIDSRASSTDNPTQRATGNLAFELITKCNPDLLKGINRTFIRTYDRDERLIIENIISDNTLDRRLSVHLTGTADYLLWSYITTKLSDLKKVNSIEHVVRHFIFNGAELSPFVKMNYKNRNWAITTTKGKSGRVWRTVVALFSILEMEKFNRDLLDICKK